MKLSIPPFLKTLSKKKKIALSVVSGLVFVGLASALFGGDDVEYITEKVEAGPLSQIVSLTGSVVADTAVELRFGLAGTVAGISVTTGEAVVEGQELARIDSAKLESEVKRTAAAVAAEEADITLMIVGPSTEERTVSQAKVHEAEISAANAVQNYENTLLSNAEALRQAELEVENAELDLDNAQITYDNTVAEQENNSSQSTNDIDAAYEDAQVAVETGFESVKQAIDSVDLLLGEIDEPLNPEFEDNLLDSPLSTRTACTQNFDSVIEALDVLEPDYASLKSAWTGEEVDAFLIEFEAMVQDAKEMVNAAYDILENMKTLDQDVVADIDTLKAIIETDQANMTSALSSIQTAIQGVDSAQLDNDSSDLNSNTTVSDASAALEQAKNLLEIAESNLQAQIVSNTINENEAQMNVDLKQVQLEQRQAEYAQLVAAPREVDLASQRARIRQAEAAYERALSELEDAIIRAPADGIVAKVNIDKGQSISSTENAISFMTPAVQISAQISETDITKVGLYNTASMTLDALPISEVFTGAVVELDPAETVIQGVVYYESTLIFDTTDPRIRPGMTVNIDVLTEERESTLQISPQALQFEDDQTFVFVYERGQAVKRLVTTGLQGEKKIEILSGLEEGETIVLYKK